MGTSSSAVGKDLLVHESSVRAKRETMGPLWEEGGKGGVVVVVRSKRDIGHKWVDIDQALLNLKRAQAVSRRFGSSPALYVWPQVDHFTMHMRARCV